MGLISDFFGSPAGRGIQALLSAFGLDAAQQEALLAQSNLIDEITSGRNETLNQTLEMIGNAGEEQLGELDSFRNSLLGNVSGRNRALIDSITGLRDDALGFFDESSEGLKASFGEREQRLLSQFAGLQDQVNTGFQERLDKGLSMLEGLGDQEKADLLERFAGEQSQFESNMTQRGLGGTLLAPSLQSGIGRERDNELSRLNERLQAQELGVFGALSGDALNAEMGLGTFGVNLGAQLSGDTLGATERLDSSRLGFLQAFSDPIFQAQGAANNQISGIETALGEQRIGTLAGMRGSEIQAFASGNEQLMQFLERTAPQVPGQTPFSAAAQAGLGAGAAGGPSKPGFDATGAAIGALSAGATGTIGVAAGSSVALGAGKIIGGLFTLGLAALACLDEDTEIMVQGDDGRQLRKPMKDVQIGEFVLGADLQYHRVEHKDHGEVSAECYEPYLKITVGGCPLVITINHPIGGKPARRWKSGDYMPMANGRARVDRVEDHKAVIGCDLALAENVDYVVANGVMVRSIVGSFMAWKDAR
jgi:hypothetical protein